MNGDTDTTTQFGIESRFGWPIGGAVAGAIGAVAFGILMWLFEPDAIQGAIPALYGLEPAGVTGWTIHVLHGAILGVLFGFLVTRRPILGVLQTDVETDALSRLGLTARLVAAGFVFGLAIWAFLPIIVLPVLTEAVAADPAGEFPGVAIESLLGHVLFGTILGAVFASAIDLTDRRSRDVLEDESSRE